MASTHKAFVAELIGLRDRHHIKNHRFFDRWVAGELTKEQMGRYMAQHFQLAGDILRPYGVAYAKAPRDVQRFLIENLAEEHGVIGTERGGPAEHDSMLLTWTDWCGLSRREVEATPPLASLRAVLSFLWYMAYQHPWQVWLAALAAQVVQESQMVGVQERTVPALHDKYNFSRGAKEIHWFEEHHEADKEHGQKGFDLLAKHVDMEPLAQECLRWAEEGLKLRWLYISEVERTYVTGNT